MAQRQQIEALLLAADSHIRVSELANFFALSGQVVLEHLQALKAAYAKTPLSLQQTASGWRFVIRPEYTAVMSSFYATKPKTLSPALLETLAIIAYNQPVTRADIEQIRGVATRNATIATLLDIGWIQKRGTKQAPGRPALFVTTKQLLDDLGLESLHNLPSLDGRVIDEPLTPAAVDTPAVF